MDSTSGVTIDLEVVDQDSKRFGTAPDPIRIGTLGVHGWQVHPVRIPPGQFDGAAAYLVKLNYELATTPHTPEINWFEFGVELHAGSVVDAVPHYTPAGQPSTSYVVNSYLNLVPVTDGATPAVYIPATSEAVHAFGVGSNGVRWQHVSSPEAAVRPGSRTVWFVALVEQDVTHLDITAAARFDLQPSPGWNVLPAHEPAELRIALHTVALRPEVSTQATENAAITLRPAGRRVFISYTHDDEEHKRLVRDFANLLMTCGVDVRLDQFEGPWRKDWYLWAIRNIDDSEFVIVIASPKCRAVGDGTIDKNEHRGMHCELGVIRDRLQDDRETWEQKLLPVVLPGEQVSNIPVFLQPRAMDHYQIDELTEDALGGLLATIRAGAETSSTPIVLTATNTGHALANS